MEVTVRAAPRKSWTTCVVNIIVKCVTLQIDDARTMPGRSARPRLPDLEVLRRPAHRNDGRLDRRDAEHVPGARRGRRGPLDPAARAAAARRAIGVPDHGRGLRRRPRRADRCSRSRASTPRSRASTPTGRRYHALNPETFYWAHATFFMLIIKIAEYFCGGLTEAEKRQLFDEHVQWYRMYGMSMRPVPETWEEFQEYWDRKCRDELEINRATLDIFTIRIPKPWFVLMPTPIWDQLFRPMVGRTALDRRGPVRPGGAREGRHALDTRRRGAAAAVRQARRDGVRRGARRDPAASARAGRLSPRVRAGCPTTRRWSRRPRSWRRRATAQACRCTTCRARKTLLGPRRVAGAHDVLAGGPAPGARPR